MHICLCSCKDTHTAKAIVVLENRQNINTNTYLKKSTSTSLNLTRGLQIVLKLIPWITLFGMLFSNESTTNDNSRRWNN